MQFVVPLSGHKTVQGKIESRVLNPDRTLQLCDQILNLIVMTPLILLSPVAVTHRSYHDVAGLCAIIVVLISQR